MIAIVSLLTHAARQIFNCITLRPQNIAFELLESIVTVLRISYRSEELFTELVESYV